MKLKLTCQPRKARRLRHQACAAPHAGAIEEKEKNGIVYSNMVQRGSKQYALEDKGIARIEEGAAGEEPCLIIDGRRFTGEEFLSMATAFNAFDMRWEFVDKA